MTLIDRIARSVFVALAVGLAWGIRGDFGHMIGAMYPGAILALALAYVSGQHALFLWMPVIAALGALGIGAGGSMSYGILHGYAQADTFINYAYGFITLFLQGSAWGTFGGALIGLMLEKKQMKTGEWLGLIGTVLFTGWMVSYLLVDVAGLRINPPRNNSSIAYMGAAIGQIIWLACNNKPIGLRGALLGYVGFGIGMAASRLLGNVANVLQFQYDFQINHWNVMETSCGLIAGFIYAFGMLGRSYPKPPENENVPLASFYGITFVLGIIPLWHRLARITPSAKLEEWAASFKSYGYENADHWAVVVLWLTDAVCALGFLGALVWMIIHFRRLQNWAAFPVLWLSGTMLLFQNLTALYFFYPHRAKLINMHNVFWIIFVLMIFYVVSARNHPLDEAEPETDEPRMPTLVGWLGWIITPAAALGLVIYLAGFVNNEKTMASANTRWPVWSWNQGPFPGRAAKP
jgi:hypothetical protein